MGFQEHCADWSFRLEDPVLSSPSARAGSGFVLFCASLLPDLVAAEEDKTSSSDVYLTIEANCSFAERVSKTVLGVHGVSMSVFVWTWIYTCFCVLENKMWA